MENSEKLQEILRKQTKEKESDKIHNMLQKVETEYKSGNLTKEEVVRYLGIRIK